MYENRRAGMPAQTVQDFFLSKINLGNSHAHLPSCFSRLVDVFLLLEKERIKKVNFAFGKISG